LEKIILADTRATLFNHCSKFTTLERKKMADQITIQNSLGKDIKIYDSYASDTEQNYFGKLTPLVTIQSNTTQSLTPIHTPVSVLIAFDTDGNPVGRYVARFNKKSFVITSQDQTIIQQTEKFIDYILANPKSDLATQLQKIFKDKSSSSQVKAVDSFFQQQSDYKDCTFSSYMLTLTHRAQTPASKSQPVENRAYSLSKLYSFLSGGGSWPSELPNIEIRDFKCSTQNDTLMLAGIISLKALQFENDAIAKNVLSLFLVDEVEAQFLFDYEIGGNIFGTRLTFIAGDFRIPVEDGKSITIRKPTVSIDIKQRFKFVVFKASAILPFNIFGSKFDTTITMVVDNVEAEIGTVIQGEHNTLPSPPPIKGVHFERIGVGMGIIFEPPSYALGLQGEFHIGEGNINVQLDDNTFALICALEEDVPNPMYISFYVPRLDFPTLVETFTDTKVAIDLPISFSNLSFQWSENPMGPLVLPDGTLTQKAFGFSGYLDLLGIQFYGDLKIERGGVEGIMTMSPLHFGNLLKIRGDGKAIAIKVDENGNPIRNNQVAKTKAMKDAISKATTKQIVAMGGPEMAITTASSPYFSLDAQVSLFELVNEKIDAKVASDGIYFKLDYGAVIQSKMQCVLKDYHNFNGDFSYRIDQMISLPTISGFSLGSIHLVTLCDLCIGISTSTSAIDFSVKGGFDFEGLRLSFGPYSEDINISKISDLLSSAERYIVGHSEDIFDFIKDASRWAGAVKKGVIEGVNDVAQGLKTAFNKTAEETASIMNSVGYGINEVAESIKTAYGASASEVAKALSVGFGASEQGVAEALKYTSFGADETARALSEVFEAAPSTINDILQGVGYKTDEIKDAFNKIGGEFSNFASQAWEVIDPSNWFHW
jgi:hypothetical protein